MSDIKKLLLIMLFLIMLVIAAGMLSSRASGQGLFTSDGKPFAKRQSKTQEPKILVDTVKILAGWGNLKLKPYFSSSNHRTTPTDSNNIFCNITPILADSTDSVYYYGYKYIEAENRVLIKSHGGVADTGKVVVITYLK